MSVVVAQFPQTQPEGTVGRVEMAMETLFSMMTMSTGFPGATF
jgi:hypothetical protein